LNRSVADPLPVSVVIVARNEERNLARCLASIAGWIEDVVVALNDTTDQSAAVAAQFGARVQAVAWEGFRDTKNASLELAGRPWALCLDADEEVSAELRSHIEEFFRRRDHERFAGARFARKVWFIDRWITHGDWYPDRVLRLVRRDAARWSGDAFVHERLLCDGPVATLRGDLHHYSFPSLASHVAKINTFADLFVRQQRAKGARFSAVNAVIRPVWRFFRGYVLRRGFLDGYPGYYIAYANAFGVLVRYGRLYEEETASRNPALDERK
jgi:glycosyltransferase involved in cell wall biosynthesis